MGSQVDRPTLALPLQLGSRVALATARGPGRRAWSVAARALARLAGARAAAGVTDTSVYTRGGLGRGDFAPGLSDVDVVVITPNAHSAERVRARWRRSAGRHPVVYAIFGEPRVHHDAELARLVGASAYTIGLGDDPDSAGFGPDGSLRDRLRLLDKPGLGGATDDWRLLSGRDRRPGRPRRSPQEERVAGWLELAFYWRHAFPACIQPERPRTALLCVKLVAEPARILLDLTTGERLVGPRTDVLRRALEVFPEEECGLRLALETERQLHRRAPAPLHASVEALVRLSGRIAATVTRETLEAGVTSVQLHGSERGTADTLPLCDWRTIVSPTHVRDTIRPGPGTPHDVAALREAALAQSAGSYVTLRDESLLVLPAAVRERNRLRAVACAASDPVTFALLEGRRSASYPDVPGWSIQHVARRAVAEHRARIASQDADLVALIGAARAALLSESVGDRTPVLAVTPEAVCETLADRPHSTALVELGAVLGERGSPEPVLVTELARMVRGLPAYAR